MLKRPLALPESVNRTDSKRPDVHEAYVVPLRTGASIHLSYNRSESLTHTHQSISPELMNVEMHRASAEVAIAKARYRAPEREKTKQVKLTAAVVVIVALASLAAICIRPEAWQGIAAVAGVVTGVFGGMFAAETLIRHRLGASKSPPPT